MFFDRQQYKAWGKTAFRRNYWKSVLAALVYAFASGTMFYRFRLNLNSTEIFDTDFMDSMMREPIYNDFVYEMSEHWAEIAAVAFLLSVIASVVVICMKAFLWNPLSLGGNQFFLRNAAEPAQLGELGGGFRTGLYLRNVSILFFRSLYIALWSLLFVIPGIIKSYEYFFVPYLAVAHPEMDRKTVFAASRAMTDGHKGEIFIMQLSFLGWNILSALTANLVGIFYVNPYKQAAYAEMYWHLAQQVGL